MGWGRTLFFVGVSSIGGKEGCSPFGTIVSRGSYPRELVHGIIDYCRVELAVGLYGRLRYHSSSLDLSLIITSHAYNLSLAHCFPPHSPSNV
ncbi:hypothetical protein L873DRAFT_823519 [Choiromyces venosus 120613-1]|uniref:Uncharacterized protein n=1 Tax=Choiromyces venosus 120613-1 TaxID=1336337 RepID=A0A3N4JST0_9PEZI|nr:hypothetical protein L873DRAFT_823519 [Choiromyces venosus 120613-1]